MLLLRSEQYFRISSKIMKSEILIRSIASSSGSQVTELNNDHIFKKVWTKHELIDRLSNKVYYEDDNYVVLSKPYGILARINRAKPVLFKGEGIVCESALSDILPDLCNQFSAANLDLIVHPQWLFSGLTILSKGKSSRKEQDILKDFQSINPFNRTYSYLAVVLGEVAPTFEGSFRISRKYEIIEDRKKPNKSIILSYKHKVLGSSNGASLIKVDLNYNYLQCLRLILATKCFSPVLGDFTYASRIATLFKVPLLVPPTEQSNPKKNLPLEILKSLQLSPEETDCCPCHVHLYSAMFRVKSKKFVAAVPPPEYFAWTCEQLGLKEVKQFFRGTDDYSECEETAVRSH